MYTTIILSTLFTATALALPQPVTPHGGQDGVWTPAAGTAATCSSNSDKVISFYVGPQLGSVVHAACKDMMPVCAWNPDERNSTTACPQVIDFPLNGTVKSTQSVNVEDASTGNKMAGWAAQFTVSRPEGMDPKQPVNWRMVDCEGYFTQLASEKPDAGCLNDMGSGVGNLKIGGDGSLKGAVFDMSIVEAK